MGDHFRTRSCAEEKVITETVIELARPEENARSRRCGAQILSISKDGETWSWRIARRPADGDQYPNLLRQTGDILEGNRRPTTCSLSASGGE